MVEVKMNVEQRMVPYGSVSPDPNQPRTEFDPAEIASLAESIRTNGLLQPVSVRANPDGDGWLIIAGERRFRAMGVLGLEEIRVQVHDDISEAAATKLQLLENIVRVDLNPVEEGKAYQKMIGQGYTFADIAETTGSSPSNIKYRVDVVTNARDEVLHLLAHGHIGWKIAKALSDLTFNGQGRLLRAMNGQEMNLAQIEALATQVAGEENQTAMFAPNDMVISTAERQAAATFADLFDRVGGVLAKLAKMEEKKPGSMAAALAPEKDIVIAKIEEMKKGLARLQRSMEARQAMMASGIGDDPHFEGDMPPMFMG
jgi:ParB family chromosome partitioning protein